MIQLPYPTMSLATYEVTKVDPGGTVQIVESAPAESDWAEYQFRPVGPIIRGRPKAAEAEPLLVGGPCLMLVKPCGGGGEPRLFRIEVGVVGVKGWTLQLGKAGAAMLRIGDRRSMIRPPALTPEELDQFRAGDLHERIMAFGRSEQELTRDELRAFPQVIPIVAATKEKPKAPESLQQARTLANPTAVGRAIHLCDGRPTFLVGPDGKPWHSWRVLLLPCLGHRDLFDEYDFSQPWIGRRTCGCSTRCPPSTMTRFTATISATSRITRPWWAWPGPQLGRATPTTGRFQTPFSPAGSPMKGATIWPLQRLTYSDVTKGADGEWTVLPPSILNHLIPMPRMARTGSRIMVAAVSPERKIPGPSRRISASGLSSRFSSASRAASPLLIPRARCRTPTLPHRCCSRTA